MEQELDILDDTAEDPREPANKNSLIWNLLSDKNYQRGSLSATVKELPPKVFLLKYSQFVGYYLSMVDDFDLPKKVYGDYNQKRDRIITTFLSRNKSTGVLLKGEKGSGKTLLTKLIARKMADMGHPTIVINSGYVGDDFNNFIQSIKQPCCVLFDEFEKVYSMADQQHLLTLLDGTMSSSDSLFLLTANNEWKIDTHFLNRPGRIYYSLTFTGLGDPFIIDYCNDKGLSESRTEQILRINSLQQLNFDMLQAIVEESLRYDESPSASIKYLNINLEGNDSITFSYTIKDSKGTVIIADRELKGNPLVKEVYLSAYYKKGRKNMWFEARMNQDTVTKIEDNKIFFSILDEDSNEAFTVEAVKVHKRMTVGNYDGEVVETYLGTGI